MKNLVEDRFSSMPVSSERDNLVDYLLPQEGDTKLYIFHHVSFLRCHENGNW